MELEIGKCYKAKVYRFNAIIKIDSVDKHPRSAMPRYGSNPCVIIFKNNAYTCKILYLENGKYDEEVILERFIDDYKQISQKVFDKAIKLHHTAMTTINALVFNNEKQL